MTCREYQEVLAESFGQASLPAELTRHLAGCPECRQVWSDLQALTDQLGDNKVFYPESGEADLVAKVVEREVRATTTITPLRRPVWMRISSIAAAAVIVMASGILYMRYDRQPTDSAANTPAMVVVDSSTLSTPTDSDELSSSAVTELLREVSSRGYFEASDYLLDDLSDDEVNYLSKTLSAGDFL
jgi:hypothetical protein